MVFFYLIFQFVFILKKFYLKRNEMKFIFKKYKKNLMSILIIH